MRLALRLATTAVTAVLLAGGARAEDRGGRGENRDRGQARSSGGRAGRPSSPSPVYRRHSVSVPRPDVPKPAINDHERARYPSRDGSGAAITQPAATRPPAHHLRVAGSASLVGAVRRQQGAESEPNHYYWHEQGGVRYSHYFDGHEHWYGFYHGPTFYWTRYHSGRWWWFDASQGRWDFWWNGFWWWPGPAGVPYAYVDNNYYPYEGQGVTVENAVNEPPPSSAPAAPAPDAKTTATSPDGSRVVQIAGPDADAFLYTKAGSAAPVFLKFLGAGATNVKFSGGASGLQILIEFKDGSYALYDANGDSLSENAVAVSSSTAPPPDQPSSLPPMPTEAPGQ